MVRWGIVGASKIAHDFCIALKSPVSSKQHEIVAIASRSQIRASEFARTHHITKVYESYELLALDDNVEIVYVSVLNPQHFEIVSLMLNHKKHVLCEKPLAMNSIQAAQLISDAEENNVFFMEGLWSRFFPVYQELSSLLDTLNNGEVRELYVKHGFIGSDNERIVQKALGGGITLDIGCYAIQIALFVFREEPKTVRAKGKVNAQGVDLYFEAELTFSAGRKALLTCSGLQQLENQATIITTKGPICIPLYWCPTMYIAFGEIHEWPLPTSPQLHYTNSLGLKYEADEVASCVQTGLLSCPIVEPQESLRITRIQDEIRRQLGVRYNCD